MSIPGLSVNQMVDNTTCSIIDPPDSDLPGGSSYTAFEQQVGLIQARS